MAILNYTTKIAPDKTSNEIEKILVRHGAKSILKEYSPDGEISGLSFIVETGIGPIPIKLPVNTDPVLAILKFQHKKNSNIKATPEQAERVAWRILKDWIEAQMAIVETGMVIMIEVFLPYIMTGTGTVYERLANREFLLEGGEINANSL